MSKLYDVILSHARAEAQAGDYAAAKTKLENKSIVNRNNKLHVLGDLIRLLGVEQASLVAATIQAVAASNPIVAGAWIALNTTGLQLADDDRQLILDQLGAAGNWPAETLKKVKELGKTERTPLEAYGLEVPTEQEIQEAWAQYLFEQEYITGKQQVDALVENGRASVVTALRALADNLEGV